MVFTLSEKIVPKLTIDRSRWKMRCKVKEPLLTVKWPKDEKFYGKTTKNKMYKKVNDFLLE